MSGNSNDNLLILRNLKKHYPVVRGLMRRRIGVVKAVDGIDIAVRRGETLGLVGESGCGKSTLGRVILRLEEPTEGEIEFDGENTLSFSGARVSQMRRKMQIIFQDPYSSLNPRQTVGRIISEGLVIHNIGKPQERRDRVRRLMDTVGLRPEHYNRYPHEFSGGQRQRIGIARALALRPDFVICDEPLSALDVSIQAQVINLLEDLQESYGLTYLFISHDLSVVRHISDRVAVMYRGMIVELADKADLFEHPLHPYTEALLQAVPVPDPRVARSRRRHILAETPTSAGDEDTCPFRPRCPRAEKVCDEEVPQLLEVSPGRFARCLRVR